MEGVMTCNANEQKDEDMFFVTQGYCFYMHE